MNASKFVNPLTISIIGVLLTVIGGCLIYFLLIKNSEDDLAAQTALFNANSAYEDPMLTTKAQQGVKDAQAAVQTVTDQWDQILNAKNPPLDFSNVMVAWHDLINELNYNLAPSIEQWMPSTGIKPTAPITNQAAPADPNLAIAQNPLIIQLNGGSTISVVGTFPQIIHHVAAWNNFNRIVLINNLSLQGISPWLTGTYTAEVVEFPHNDTAAAVPVPSGSGGAGAAAPRTVQYGPPAGFTPPTGPH